MYASHDNDRIIGAPFLLVVIVDNKIVVRTTTTMIASDIFVAGAVSL
jgi:hypothetical protein